MNPDPRPPHPASRTPTPASRPQHSVVLGAGGYIGRHLALALRDAGHRVDCYDAPAVAKESDELGEWDVTDASFVPAGLETADYLFIFAGLSGTADSFDRWREYVAVNEFGLLNVLENLSGMASQPKLIFPSSRLVYAGKEGERLIEDDPKEAKTIYASSKLAGEALLDLYSRQAGLRYTVFRLCVPYGNRCSGALSYGTLRHFVERASRGEPIAVYGDGSQRRSLIHVEDLCRIIVSASALTETDNGIFNLGGPDNMSVLEVASAIGSHYGVPVETVAWPEDALRMESGDTVFDDSRLNAIMPLEYRTRFADWVGQLAK